MENKSGCAVNIDSDFLWYIYESCGCNFSQIEKKLDLYVDGYIGYGISDLIYCVFAQNSVFPSKTFGYFGDNLNRKKENGQEVDYANHPRLIPFKYAFENTKAEPVQYLLDKTKEAGIRTWLSVRMNDCHNSESKTSWIRNDFYYEAKSKGWLVGKNSAPSYFSYCYDYSQKEVRDKMLGYIEEVIDRYDFDGLELDFMREIYCFDYMNCPDKLEIMTEFVRNVRSLTKRKSEKIGRPIYLSVRVARSVEYNKIFGLDVECWIKESLVDVLIPTSRADSTDSEMPIGEWGRLKKEWNFELWAGLEFLVQKPYVNSAETVRGFASQYFDIGADKIYLFNYFRERAGDENDKNISFEISKYDDYYKAEDERNRGAWLGASTEEASLTGTRRHIMTSVEPQVTPLSEKQISCLPLDISGKNNIVKLTGEISEIDNTLLYISIESGDPPIIYVDEKESIFLGESDNAFYSSCKLCGAKREDLPVKRYYAYTVFPSNGSFRNIKVVGNCKLTYLEFKIN